MNVSAIRIAFACIYLLTAATLSGCTSQSSKDQPPSASGANSTQQKGATPGPSAGIAPLETTTVLATVDNLRPSLKEAQTHGRNGAVVFGERGRGVAYIREQYGRQQVVHNGKAGAVYPEISHLTISPDGRRVSYRFTSGNKQQMVSDGVPGLAYDNARDPLYSPDSRHMAYLTQAGDEVRIVLDDKLLADSPVNNGIFFSNDSTKLVYTTHSVDNLPARLVIQDLKTGSRTVKECLDIPIAVNNATDRIAMAVKEGDRQRVIRFAVSAPDDVTGSDLHDGISNISLSSDGQSVAFISSKKNTQYLVLNGREERLPGERGVAAAPVIRPDLKGAGVILSTLKRQNNRFTFHQALHGDGSQNKEYDEIQDVAYGSDSNSVAFVAKKGEMYCVVINGREGPAFDKAVTPLFSPDGKKLVYRARTAGKRFVVVADVSGGTSRVHPEYEMVFPTVFTADGASVAYGVKDGNQLVWKVEKL